MSGIPLSEPLDSTLTGDLAKDLDALRRILNCPENKDVVFRDFAGPGFPACLVYVEGMADAGLIGELVLRAAFFAGEAQPPVLPEQRAAFLRERVLAVAQAEPEKRLSELVSRLLDGMTALLAEGCPEAICLETRGFAARPVGRTLNESVVAGAQEGFVESLRVNTTLVRRYLRSPQLITEYVDIGAQAPLRVAVMYVKGVADPALVSELMGRLTSIQAPAVLGIGQVQQLIEDHPAALVPQMLQTERPDRTASCLLEGQIALFADNSPYALVAPATLFHLLHASDDSFLRWQYGTFLRLIRMIGVAVSLYLPAFYIALTLFHPHLMPMALLTSIAETRARVPFSVVAEVLLMETSFYLINEAGTRMPAQIGSALGIVGALILGQAAVSASVISPILIIIIAITGLGNYAIPNYPLSLGVVIYRLALEAAAAIWGFYGMLLVSFLILCRLAGMRSLGTPYCAPIAPVRPHNPDILLRLPLKYQVRKMFFARGESHRQAQKKRGERSCG